MKRVMIVVALAAFVLGSVSANAGLSRGEQKKLGRFLADCLDPFASDDDRQDAWAKFTEHFDDRKARDLAEIEDLSTVLAHSADRDSPGRSGAYEREFSLSDIGMRSDEKWKYFVSLPRKYSGSSNSDAWPLIVCLPDQGQDLEEYLDAYWADEEVRDTHVIVVLDFDYSERTVTEKVPVKDEKTDKIKYEEQEKVVPFSWDSTAALMRFWKYLVNVQLREFKIDPNRITLDGVGIGQKGAVELALGNAWRIAGLVLREEPADTPALQNLKYVQTAWRTPDGAAPPDELATLLGDRLTVVPPVKGEDEADPIGGWLGDVRRMRYPLPMTWVATDRSAFFFYWGVVTQPYENDQPVKITIDKDKKQNAIVVETENVAEFSLYVNDLIADMDEEVLVIVNGEEKGNWPLVRSADMLLRHAFAHPEGKYPRDPGCVFTNEIIGISVPRPVEEEED